MKQANTLIHKPSKSNEEEKIQITKITITLPHYSGFKILNCKCLAILKIILSFLKILKSIYKLKLQAGFTVLACPQCSCKRFSSIKLLLLRKDENSSG